MMLSKYFSEEEMQCPCCGKTALDAHAMTADEFQEFLSEADALREILGFPLPVTSAYRCPARNSSVNSSDSSRHLVGDALDIAIRGQRAYWLVKMAAEMGWHGIGISQRGESRFVHIDRRKQPMIWSY